jgi:hypothetical protein
MNTMTKYIIENPDDYFFRKRFDEDRGPYSSSSNTKDDERLVERSPIGLLSVFS